MRIRKLYLKDIGPFDEVEFEFKPQENGKAEIHILTGPNGSGKTTVLHALSQLFIHSLSKNKNKFLKRLRSREQSKVQIEYESPDLESRMYEFTAPDIDDIRSKVHYTAFANSGYRKIDHAFINAIQEIEIDPQEDALVFEKESKTNFTINQWLANSISKRAIEKERNNLNQAKKFASAMTIVEKAISDIAGYEIKFDLKTSPLSLIACVNNTALDFDVLPDGLRSAISWVGDILMRLDLMGGENNVPANEENMILLLDEIEVHLHPAWQRKVLPAVQKLFPNAQIFLTTHSPFVVNSVDGAWVYDLGLKDGKASLEKTRLSKAGESYEYILRDIFDIETRFGGETQKDLDLFQQHKNELLQGKPIKEEDFLKLARRLATQSLELQSIIQFELRQLNRIKGKSYEI